MITQELSIQSQPEKKKKLIFFALGYPLIDSILDFCREPTFQGNFTVFNLKSDFLQKFMVYDSSQQNEFYLFVFTIKFQGYIMENQISAIVMDQNGNEN